jgi:putative membrane protein
VGDHHLGVSPEFLDIAGPLLALIGIGIYLRLVGRTRGKSWPRHRTVVWIVATFSAAAAVTGPLAEAAETSFAAHMLAHLLLGMVAPLLLALAAPIALFLRALPVAAARRVSRLLTSGPVRFVTEPVAAAALSLGGLWALYLTGLYPAMHRDPVLHVVVHAHMFLAGYLFTIAIVSVDPLPHRRSYRHRAIVLILGLAAHDILAKYLYAHPAIGVSAPAGETGAMIMYYGGDAVDLAMMVLLCARWYRITRPRRGAGARAPAAIASALER